ncbi:gp24 [Streptococcus pneumoniae]|nr:gp24 [Streptococcus pneumoniae]
MFILRHGTREDKPFLRSVKGWLPKSKEFDDWVGYSPGMSQVVIAVYLIYGGN